MCHKQHWQSTRALAASHTLRDVESKALPDGKSDIKISMFYFTNEYIAIALISAQVEPRVDQRDAAGAAAARSHEMETRNVKA